MRVGYNVKGYPTGLQFKCITQSQIKGLRSQAAAALRRLDGDQRPCGDACIWCGNCVRRLYGGSRDVIRTFSEASRYRLREKILSVDWPAGVKAGQVGFLGLTFRDAVTVTEAKKALHRWLQAFGRKYPQGVLIWVLEFQRRGCPHFHILFDLQAGREGFLDWAIRTWTRVTEGAAPPSAVDLSWCYAVKGVQVYLVDVTKDGYQKMPPPGVLPGRFWGDRRHRFNEVDPITIWDYEVYAAAYEGAIFDAFGEAADLDKSRLRIVFTDRPKEILAAALASARGPPASRVFTTLSRELVWRQRDRKLVQVSAVVARRKLVWSDAAA